MLSYLLSPTGEKGLLRSCWPRLRGAASPGDEPPNWKSGIGTLQRARSSPAVRIPSHRFTERLKNSQGGCITFGPVLRMENHAEGEVLWSAHTGRLDRSILRNRFHHEAGR